MNIMDFQHKRVHFIAIGGSSMSGLAMMLVNLGFDKVSGSDWADGKALPPLRAAGITVATKHDTQNMTDAELIIYSAAIGPKNCEYAYAVEHGIPMLRRDELLGMLSAHYEKCIGVSGTHGKTTTTGMISEAFNLAKRDATIHIGGVLPQIHSNVRLGHGETFITEACEYVDSFLTLRPTTAIVLNIDSEHLDYFKNLENIYQSFLKYVSAVPEDGVVIGCGDDEQTARLMNECGKRCISYGFGKDNDYYPDGIAYSSEGFARFALLKKGTKVCDIELSVVGKPNIINSIAAFICCTENGIPTQTVVAALKEFRGVMRRFEDRGICNGARVVHDYAHHPTEVAATILAAEHVQKKRLWVVFQPPTFSRTKTQFDRLVTCFKGADKVIIIDIYPAREAFDPTIHSKMIVDKITSEQHQDCIYIPTMEEAADYLKEHLTEGDLCLILGSGSIDKLDSFIFKK